MIGSNKEDEFFNSEEHFVYIKRRNSITNLIQYFKKDDLQLNAKIKQVQDNIINKDPVK
jgi:hypothetical protein